MIAQWFSKQKPKLGTVSQTWAQHRDVGPEPRDAIELEFCVGIREQHRIRSLQVIRLVVIIILYLNHSLLTDRLASAPCDIKTICFVVMKLRNAVLACQQKHPHSPISRCWLLFQTPTNGRASAPFLVCAHQSMHPRSHQFCQETLQSCG